MSNSNIANNTVYKIGDIVIFQGRIHVVRYGPIRDYHGENHYWLQPYDEAPVSAPARQIEKKRKST